jgi:hypothetical protein
VFSQYASTMTVVGSAASEGFWQGATAGGVLEGALDDREERARSGRIDMRALQPPADDLGVLCGQVAAARSCGGRRAGADQAELAAVPGLDAAI